LETTNLLYYKSRRNHCSALRTLHFPGVPFVASACVNGLSGARRGLALVLQIAPYSSLPEPPFRHGRSIFHIAQILKYIEDTRMPSVNRTAEELKSELVCHEVSDTGPRWRCGFKGRWTSMTASATCYLSP
jgi:hypothetical protein